MGCCGKHLSKNASGLPDIERNTLPSDECILCAEKHLSTAYSLAIESGYEGLNRPSIVGQLVLAQWHCWHASREIAEMIRDIRHQIQQRKESGVDWLPVLSFMDTLVTATLRDMATS